MGRSFNPSAFAVVSELYRASQQCRTGLDETAREVLSGYVTEPDIGWQAPKRGIPLPMSP